MTRIIIGLREKVFINDKQFFAKIDTGAILSSVDKSIINKSNARILKGKIKVMHAGKASIRDVCKLRIKIKGKFFYSLFTISDRKNMKEKVLIGQNILKGNFLIRP